MSLLNMLRSLDVNCCVVTLRSGLNDELASFIFSSSTTQCLVASLVIPFGVSRYLNYLFSQYLSLFLPTLLNHVYCVIFTHSLRLPFCLSVFLSHHPSRFLFPYLSPSLSFSLSPFLASQPASHKTASQARSISLFPNFHSLISLPRL